MQLPKQAMYNSTVLLRDILAHGEWRDSLLIEYKWSEITV